MRGGVLVDPAFLFLGHAAATGNLAGGSRAYSRNRIKVRNRRFPSCNAAARFVVKQRLRELFLAPHTGRDSNSCGLNPCLLEPAQPFYCRIFAAKMSPPSGLGTQAKRSPPVTIVPA
jgi:hypothetical protein